MTSVRSFVFNVAYYAVSALMVAGSLPIFLVGSQRAIMWIIRLWGHVGIGLLRAIVGTRFEVRGIDNIPPGRVIIASKHQSMFETFALFTVLDRASIVMKQELTRIPLWGWYARRAGMIMVERDQGTTALRRLAAGVKAALADNRPVVIFPEGTRRPPGAEPDYKGGVAHLYRLTGVPVVPAAVNSGFFWPRHHLARYPGTIVIAFLPPIMPGLKAGDFAARLQAEIEEASDRLIVETAAMNPRPPFPTSAAARLDELGRA